jgi:serine/threonine-protein kinase SRPK3
LNKDLKSDNFLVGFEDSTVLEDYVRKQQNNPATYKLSHGHQIYQSESDFGRLKKGVGMVKISDFSASVFGNVSTPNNHNIQPLPFCAPEVLLEATWTYSADIWNLGNVVSFLKLRCRQNNTELLPSCGSSWPKPLFLMGKTPQAIIITTVERHI